MVRADGALALLVQILTDEDGKLLIGGSGEVLTLSRFCLVNPPEPRCFEPVSNRHISLSLRRPRDLAALDAILVDWECVLPEIASRLSQRLEIDVDSVGVLNVPTRSAATSALAVIVVLFVIFMDHQATDLVTIGSVSLTDCMTPVATGI